MRVNLIVMKIQPVDFNAPPEPQTKPEAAARAVLKLRFRRLFERPFSGVLRTSAHEKPSGVADPAPNSTKDAAEEFEPSSVCLAKMVQNFIEENNDKQTQRCGRRKCNCFHRNCPEISDEEPFNYTSGHAIDVLKSLVPCSSSFEKNIVADVAKIVEKHKISKQFSRKIVADGLIALGYKASICKSKWEKTSSFLAGEYEYVDVMIKAERLIIDIDFRSEFEIARSTKAYQLLLQTLPNIFVGKSGRLEKIISIVAEAAKQSLKKKGMPLPPWRKADYVKAKWLSPFTRLGDIAKSSSPAENVFDINCDCALAFSNSNTLRANDLIPWAKKWEPWEIRPKNVKTGVKVVTGLASVMEDKP